MSQHGGTLRSRLLRGESQAREEMIDALESRLDATEEIAHKLTCSGGLVHEHDGTSEEKGPGGALIAFTDRKIVTVIDTGAGVETADIPYTDVKSVDIESGFLSTRLSIEIWGRGKFRLDPDSGVDAVVNYSRAASDAWQRVVAALQDARQYATALSNHLESGEVRAAAESLQSARDNIQKATERADGADEMVQDALEERIETVETELARTRMKAHFERVRSLASTANTRLETDDYDGAHAKLRRASDHVDTALSIAIRRDFSMANRIQSSRDKIAEQIDYIESQPLERAEQARARAQAADDLDVAALAWKRVLTYYREALTAGWGTDADFDGDRDALRMQIEWVVAKLIQSHRQLARRYEADGDEYRIADANTVAQDRYEMACYHFMIAEDLAREYRTGDTDQLRQQFDWIAGKLGSGA